MRYCGGQPYDLIFYKKAANEEEQCHKINKDKVKFEKGLREMYAHDRLYDAVSPSAKYAIKVAYDTAQN